jgi:trafficking protein particle complex subunit 3
VDKVNAELVTLTYGTVVAQLCNDCDSDYVEVNRQLDRMGYNIGLRLIEDFFAKSNTGRCSNFKETAEVVSKASELNLPSCGDGQHSDGPRWC